MTRRGVSESGSGTSRSFVDETPRSLKRRAPGDLFLEGPKFCVVFEAQHAIFGREAQPPIFHQLILKVDAGAIENQWDILMFVEKILSEDQVENMDGIVVAFSEHFREVLAD